MVVGGVSGIYNQRECFYGLLRNGYVAYLRKLASSTKSLVASKILTGHIKSHPYLDSIEAVILSLKNSRAK